MAHALVATASAPRPRPIAETATTAGCRVFESLLDSSSTPVRRAAPLLVSFAAHAALVTAAVVIPVVLYDALPDPGQAVHVFFVTPSLAPPPPPPPPPPAAGVRVARTPAAAPTVANAPSFVAPLDVKPLVPDSDGLDLSGVEGGVPGGVEGGVPGGVVGGVIGGLPLEPPPAPRKAVRVGGALVAPKLVHRVAPVYPELAALTRIHGVVILEATVDENGRVEDVTIVRGQPVLQEAAVEAVKQWRYQPLLLNGEATPFILTVTLNFNLNQ